tara:strand:+ start:573 stop:782 length:210 start_codon:yes stop_codon:yes gene_type:complete
MTKLINIARQYCANWDAGKCVGCVFVRKEKGLFFKLNKKLSGKKCSVDKGCDYFETVVIPGIENLKYRR